MRIFEVWEIGRPGIVVGFWAGAPPLCLHQIPPKMVKVAAVWQTESTVMSIKLQSGRPEIHQNGNQASPPERGACSPLRSGVYRGSHRGRLYFEGVLQPRGEMGPGPRNGPRNPGMAPGGRLAPGCAGAQRYVGFTPETYGIRQKNMGFARVSGCD